MSARFVESISHNHKTIVSVLFTYNLLVFFTRFSRLFIFVCFFFWLVNVYCVFSNDGFSFEDRERKYAKNTHSNAIQNHFGNCQFEWIEAFVGVISSALYVEFFFRAYFLNRCTQVYLWMWCFFLVGFLCSTSDKCTILWTIDVFWLHFPVLVFERVRIHLAHKHIYWISFFCVVMTPLLTQNYLECTQNGILFDTFLNWLDVIEFNFIDRSIKRLLFFLLHSIDDDTWNVVIWCLNFRILSIIVIWCIQLSSNFLVGHDVENRMITIVHLENWEQFASHMIRIEFCSNKYFTLFKHFERSNLISRNQFLFVTVNGIL